MVGNKILTFAASLTCTLTYHSDITVSFQQPINSVTEGQIASVCAVITGSSNIQVNVVVSTTPVTAEG